MYFFLFPGQGSQQPGMGQDFYEHSTAARAVFDEAAAIMPAGFLDLLFGGEQDTLNDTRNAQPGLLTASVAVAAELKQRGVKPEGCAGHSLGEISALVAAEACSFSDALRFTRERARLMSENVPAGGMAAVMGLAPDAIEAALPPGVQVANYNGPSQTIISGSAKGLDAAEAALTEAGAKRVLRLKVSGPFHSEFMKPAAEEFARVLAGVPFKSPACPFVSSVNAALVKAPDAIRSLLAQQLYSPIRWTEVMAAIGAVPALEVGPGNVLRGLAKRAVDAPEVTCAGTYEAVHTLTHS